MYAEDLMRLAAQVGYVVLFVIVLARAVRSPRPSNWNAAAFFGCVALLIVMQRIMSLAGRAESEAAGDLEAALILLFSFLLLRLADDFLGVRQGIRRAASLSVAASVAVVFVFPEPLPGIPLLLVFGTFLAIEGYASARFIRAARRTQGLTQKRLRSVSVGSALLLVLVLFAIPAAALPSQAPVWSSLASAAGLGSGIAFFVGFALPDSLKAVWQSPEVRRLLDVQALARWMNDVTLDEFIRTVQADAASVLSTDRAVVWIEDGANDDLVAPVPPDAGFRPGELEAARHVHQDGAGRIVAADGGHSAGADLLAPIRLEGRSFGVLSAFTPNATAFAEDDLWLLQLLAEQVALALAHRDLLGALSDARARDEVNRQKEDFLSSAAHDLQTPLTTLLGEAQLMEQRALRNPGAVIDLDRTRRMIVEGRRMRSLIREFLDSSRADQGSLVGERVLVDLTEVARESVERALQRGDSVVSQLDVAAPVIGDRARLVQVVDNLLENAVKYSPAGGEVRVTVETGDGTAMLAVADSGIGIAPEDLPFVFDRFWRSRSVGDREYAGMGLGLFISQRIVDDHGGGITVRSQLGEGTTFLVRLPLIAATPTENDSDSPGRRDTETKWATPTSL